MKLTRQQINRVRAFISRRGFTYYDVQLEIIDHVACKVEYLMTADPNLTLDNAIAQTHADFGVMGFSVVEDAMRKALQKRYWILFYQTFLSYLKPIYWPLETGLVYLVYLLSKTAHSVDTFIAIVWGIIFSLIAVYMLTNYRRQKKYRRMLTMHMGNMAIIVVNLPMQMYLNLFNMARCNLKPDGIAIVMGVFLTCVFIVFLTIKHLQKVALDNCRELEDQYQLNFAE